MVLRGLLSGILLNFIAVGMPTPVGCAERSSSGGSFTITDGQFLLNGKPFAYRAGEIHPARVPKAYWRHRLQMLKAMGLNAVGIYLFWNQIEPAPGRFDWTDQADYPEFCRIAQDEGMWVILRPGPYVCAEWDMGGHPWWLARDPPKEVRSRDPKYFQPALRYLEEVCRVMAPYQITWGGPIILYQVENEYSKSDQEYLSALKQVALDHGITVPLIACNPPGDAGRRFKLNYRDDLFQTANFGRGGAEGSIALLKQFKKEGPYANGEYYPGWFDSWGRNHISGSPKVYIKDLTWMLEHRISFSIYMAHGGTNFGLWASGGPAPIRPLTTSYDYDAPVSESGQVTEKFTLTRDAITTFLAGRETLPPIPAPIPTIAVAPVTFTEVHSVTEPVDPAIVDETPRNMEAYDQGYGAMLYRTELDPGPAGELAVHAVGDFAWVLLNGTGIGHFDRRYDRFSIPLPALKTKAVLDIFVLPMGRGNSGKVELKGLFAPVTRSGAELKGWKIHRLPLDTAMLTQLPYRSGPVSGPAFHRASFTVPTIGDTFLDFRKLGMGVMWVNGRCLGRYWNIGPQQTLFCPGAWLKPGANEVVILECLDIHRPEIVGLPQPILAELHNELDFTSAPPVSAK
jgi:beta-galactosidase